MDRGNNVYVTGNSFSTWGEDPIRAHSGNHDAFVAKLTSNGTMVWNTFLGSTSSDYGRGIAVGGAADNVYVIGQSSGSVFVAKLYSSGALQWTSYMGSSEDDLAGGIAVDQNEYIYVVGSSLSSWGDPVRYHSTGGFWDAFAAKYNSSGTRIWNTFLGSGHDDFGSGIAVDGSGNVYVTGISFLTWDTPRRAHAGDNDAFVVKLNNIGRAPMEHLSGFSQRRFRQRSGG